MAVVRSTLAAVCFSFSVNSSWICGLECLIQLASYKDKYKDVFRDVGLLEVLTNCLKCYCVALKEIYGGKQCFML